MWELVFRVQLGFAEQEVSLGPHTGGERILASVPQTVQLQEECMNMYPLAGRKGYREYFACVHTVACTHVGRIVFCLRPFRIRP